MRRRRPRASRVLMLLSLVVAATATVVLRDHLMRLEARARAADAGPVVVVAARALSRGTVLDPSSLTTGRVPVPYLPPGALGDPSAAVGRVLTADVMAGEVLTNARLASAGGPVAALVPPGLRAVPVTAAVPEGTVAPGDRVDVLATFHSGEPFARTVAAEVEVLLVLSGQAPADLGPAATVVLLVSPETAERLAHARVAATLTLAVAPPPAAGPSRGR